MFRFDIPAKPGTSEACILVYQIGDGFALVGTPKMAVMQRFFSAAESLLSFRSACLRCGASRSNHAMERTATPPSIKTEG
jgi:hypothetical protein